MLTRVLSVFFLLITLLAGSVSAQATGPADSGAPPIPPDSVLPTGPQPAQARSALRLPPLKAVLVVGALDTPDVTNREIANAELVARELELNGVSVSRFYTPNDDWNQIKSASTGAHFFMYRGHGIYWGALPNPPVGGMALQGKLYSNDDIRSGLRLAPKAIVLIYSCFSSGSSTTDKASISLTEARRRVDEYSAPYLDLGASVVLANWYPDAFQYYIRYLFQGMTLGQAFTTYYDFDPAMANLGVHPSRPGLSMWLEYENWSSYPIPPLQYDSALVGTDTATLEQLFSPRMTLSSQNISVLVKPNSPAVNLNVTVGSSSDYAFNWTAAESASWINTSPTSGTSGGGFTLQVLPGGSTGVYDTSITVNTLDPNVVDNNQAVQVRMVVTNTIYKVFIPTTRR